MTEHTFTPDVIHSSSNPLLKIKTGTDSDSAIPRRSLTSAVADKLRDQIIRGEIAEGAQLRQDVIARQYHVSRIPVREALRQLDAEGLITIVPNRGAVVPALSGPRHRRIICHPSAARARSAQSLHSSPHPGRPGGSRSGSEQVRERTATRRAHGTLGKHELAVPLHPLFPRRSSTFHVDRPQCQP
jgi:DNA-binding transcriptional MocR family regulator